MPTVTSEVLADTLNVSAVVEGIPIAISELTYSAKINSARVVNFTVNTRDYAQICRLGAKVDIQSGREGSISNLSFKGIIKTVVPTVTGAMLTAMDYITSLATSSFVNYKDEDILGRDLYFLVASAMNIDEIDTTSLTQGSGIRATSAMQLKGLQLRKTFIDKCFRHMYKLVDDSTSYRDKINVIHYQYNIPMSNRMEIKRIDEGNVHTKPSLSISDRSNQVETITAKLDTSTMVNSATVVSSTNEDMVFTYTDNDSVAKYGVMSELITLNTDNYPELVNEAVRYVGRYSKESYNFVVVIRNVDSLVLGDLVEVDIPNLERKIKLPIISYNVDTSTGVKSTITLGRKTLSLSEIIDKI